ncbi:MAG: hypothetical protein ACOYNN_19030 [Terrimicrobiaceae bacterium]|jgi:hypothetical protein
MEHIFAIGLGIWSALLTAFVGVIGFVAREKNTKLKDLEQMLINTKLEVARDNVTKAEVDKITAHIDQRFNKLEAKIDQLIQKGLAT